jgi:hypothetical protein
MAKIIAFLSGKKTIIMAVLAALCSIARAFGVPIPEGTEETLYSLALIFLRVGMSAEKLKVTKSNGQPQNGMAMGG